MTSLAEKLKNKASFDLSSYHPLAGEDMETNMAYAKLLAFAIMADEKVSEEEKKQYTGIVQSLNLPVEDCLDYLKNLDLDDFEPLCSIVSKSENAKRCFFLDACFISHVGSAENELFEMIRTNIGIKKNVWDNLLISSKTISTSTNVEEILSNPARYSIEEYLHILQKRGLIDSFVEEICRYEKTAEEFCDFGINEMNKSYNEIYDSYLSDVRYEDKHGGVPGDRIDRHARRCDRAFFFCRGYGNPLVESEMTSSWSFRDCCCFSNDFDSWKGIQINYNGTQNLFVFQNKISPFINGLLGLEPEYARMKYKFTEYYEEQKSSAELLDGNRKRLACWKYSLLLMCGAAKRLLSKQARNLFEAIQKEASDEKYDAHYEAFKDKFTPAVRAALHGSLSNGKAFSEGRSAVILSCDGLVDMNGKDLKLVKDESVAEKEEQSSQTNETKSNDTGHGFLFWRDITGK